MSYNQIKMQPKTWAGNEYLEDLDLYEDNPFNQRLLAERIEYVVLAIQCLPKKRRDMMNKVFIEGYQYEGHGEKSLYVLGVRNIKSRLKEWGVL